MLMFLRLSELFLIRFTLRFRLLGFSFKDCLKLAMDLTIVCINYFEGVYDIY